MKQSFLKTLLDTHIAPFLAEHRFKRRVSTWSRKVDGIIHKIRFEVSKSHCPNCSEMFTVEAGVAADAVVQALQGRLPKSYHAWTCLTVERIGYLRPAGDRFDKWWDLTTESDIPRVADDVIHDLRTLCLPVLDEIKNLHDVRAFVNEVDIHKPKAPLLPYVKLGLAALCYAMGDLQEYERLKGSLMRGEGFKYAPAVDLWRSRMIEVDERLRARPSEISQ